MKRVICLILVFFGAIACSGPKDIPIEDMQSIVHDIYLSNAIVGTYILKIQVDSLNIYKPIFDKYGYKASDFAYTIESLSKRKSIRFADIINSAIEQIQAEGQIFTNAVNKIDTTKARISKLYRQTILADSLPRYFTKIASEKESDLIIPVKQGKYEIEYSYLVDTADRNSYIQYTHHTVDSLQNKSDYVYRAYTKNVRLREKIVLDIPRTMPRNLEIVFAYNGLQNDKPTNLRIDSLRIYYYLPIDKAVDSFRRQRILLPDSLGGKFTKQYRSDYERNKEDYVTLRLDTARVAQRGDSLIQQ